MKPIFLIVALSSGIQAQAPHRFGAIDGVSIPSKVWSGGEARVCGNLQAAISQAARDRAKRELGIYATKEEVEARRKLVVKEPHFRGGQAQYRERLQGLVDGLSAVYDRGMDPQQAYQQLAAPHKVIQLDWDQQLALGRDRRQKLVEQLAAATPEGFDKAAANYDARPAVEDDKLKAAIDAQIAASDATFKAYLNEYNAVVTHPSPYETRFRGRAVVRDYLDRKRNVWWHAFGGKLSVTLSDQSLYATCNLPAMGVTVPRH